jgi:threonine/homoserine/homoserine lactone efflux protein
MMLSVMIASALLALSIAAPFGPISLMCVQRSLVSHRWRGIACGAGASTAHGAFAALALLGAHFAIGQATSLKPVVAPLSGLLLLALGVRILLASRRTSGSAQRALPAAGDYAAGLSLALCNPATILPYLALSGSGGLHIQALFPTLAATILGVMAGSLAWYACLACFASALQDRISRSMLERLNILSGVTLAVMGLWMILLSPSAHAEPPLHAPAGVTSSGKISS